MGKTLYKFKCWFNKLPDWPKFLAERSGFVLVALILFAEFQHHPQGGGMTEGEAMEEFIDVRREHDDAIRTEAINNLVHRGTENEY